MLPTPPCACYQLLHVDCIIEDLYKRRLCYKQYLYNQCLSPVVLVCTCIYLGTIDCISWCDGIFKYGQVVKSLVAPLTPFSVSVGDVHSLNSSFLTIELSNKKKCIGGEGIYGLGKELFKIKEKHLNFNNP
jgi:hypothetical protein